MPKSLRIPHLLALIFLPASSYLALFFLRSWWYLPHCATAPEQCSLASINPFDQWALPQKSVFADFCSNVTQNGVGLAAFVLPWILLRQSRVAGLLNLVLLSLISWNGLIMEGIRALVQRPRPQVLAAPLTEGANIHQYTSFYSGHTSFVAIAAVFTLVWVEELLPERIRLRGPIGVIGMLMTGITGVLRVLGGRHYPSDVVGGIFFGVLIGYPLAKALITRLPRSDRA